MIQFIGITLGVLFLALLYLHYRVNKAHKYISVSHSLIQTEISILLTMLSEKDVLTLEDIQAFSKGQSLRKKDSPTESKN